MTQIVTHLTDATQAGGDLSGLLLSPTVNKIKGITITGTPVAGKALVLDNPTQASWQTIVTGNTYTGSTGIVLSGYDFQLDSTASPTFKNLYVNNTTADATLESKTTAANKGAYLSIDATSSTAMGILGKIASSQIWGIGNIGDSTGLNFYTNYVRAIGISSSQVTNFYGNVTFSSGKTLTLSGAGAKITTRDLQINTSVAPSVGQVWTATDTSGNGSWQSVAAGGGGTVTTVSVVSANGFAGSVANATSTPAITISTSITGLLKGNGTAISAATAGTDYQAPITLTTTGTSGAATLVGSTLNIPQYAGATYSAGTGLTLTTGTFSVKASQNITTLSNLTSNGLIKTSGGTGELSIASAGTDYVVPSGSITGNAATATILQTSRTINGVSFDGSANITIFDSTKQATIAQTATKTSAYTASVGDLVVVDTSAGTFTVTLPTAPADKSRVAIKKIDTSTTAVTIACGGSDLFTTSGLASTTMAIPGQATTYQYNSATSRWTGVSNDINAASIQTSSTVFQNLYALNTTTDVTLEAKTSATNKGAYISMDATSTDFQLLQGKVSGTQVWGIGRSGVSTGLHFYIGFTEALALANTTYAASFAGDIVMATGKNITFATSGTGSIIGATSSNKFAFWGATPVAKPTGNLLTAVNTIGLVGSPTIAESDVTNLTTDLANLASPLTTKGDLYGFSTTKARIPVGTNGQLLMADSTAAAGVSWQTVSGTGSVTSVDVSGGTTGLTTSGGPITTTGTITLAGTLVPANGGTGTTTAFTAGSVVFAGASGVYSQSNSNLFWDNTNNRLGLLTGAPTHTLTIGTGGASAIYNTADQTTNFERFTMSWVSNVATISTGQGGTGTARNINISSAAKTILNSDASSLTLTMDNNSSAGYFTLARSAAPGGSNQSIFLINSGLAGAGQSQLAITGSMTNSSGTNYGLRVAPTINQTSTAGSIGLYVNPTVTAAGSGSQLLASFAVGGTNKLSIDSNGKLNMPTGGAAATVGTATLSAGTATVSTTSVTASSIIILTVQSLGTVSVAKSISVGTKTAGTSFVINSEDVTDTSVIGWQIIN